MKDKIISVTRPILQQQTLFQLNQLKSFIDTSLKEATSKNFDNESEKIKYLLDTLYNIRDFVLTQTVENSLRASLIKQFDAIEQEAVLGNEAESQNKELSQKVEESLEQDQ